MSVEAEIAGDCFGVLCQRLFRGRRIQPTRRTVYSGEMVNEQSVAVVGGGGEGLDSNNLGAGKNAEVLATLPTVDKYNKLQSSGCNVCVKEMRRGNGGGLGCRKRKIRSEKRMQGRFSILAMGGPPTLRIVAGRWWRISDRNRRSLGSWRGRTGGSSGYVLMDNSRDRLLHDPTEYGSLIHTDTTAVPQYDKG